MMTLLPSITCAGAYANAIHLAARNDDGHRQPAAPKPAALAPGRHAMRALLGQWFRRTA